MASPRRSSGYMSEASASWSSGESGRVRSAASTRRPRRPDRRCPRRCASTAPRPPGRVRRSGRCRERDGAVGPAGLDGHRGVRDGLGTCRGWSTSRTADRGRAPPGSRPLVREDQLEPLIRGGPPPTGGDTQAASWRPSRSARARPAKALGSVGSSEGGDEVRAGRPGRSSRDRRTRPQRGRRSRRTRRGGNK